MRCINTIELTRGMVLSQNIISRDGVKLLDKHTFLTETHIHNLVNWGVNWLYILDGVDNKVVFIEKYKEIITAVQEIFESIQQSRQIPIVKIRQLAEEMISPLIAMEGVLDYLYDVKSHSNYTFEHSVNVAITTGFFSNWLHYGGVEYKDIIIAGLLHDIGKLTVPLHILDKPDKLLDSEFNAIKKHPEEGYNFFKTIDEIPVGTKMGVWQHHERMDGSGYPCRLKGSEIHEYAKVIAVADIYDAMTSNRAYRGKVTPLAAMEVIAEQMYDKLDCSICIPILENMRKYFIGREVLLSNGQKGEIIMIRSHAWEKPMVRAYNGVFLDLRHEKISVVDVL